MTKMAKLIQNELIKTFRKTSTLILFILVLIICIGYMLLMKVSENNFTSYVDDSEIRIIDCDMEIKRTEAEKYTGYELDLEKLNFMKENDISMGWKAYACREIFVFSISDDLKAEYIYSDAEREAMKKVVMNDEWKTYCEFMINSFKESGASEEEYWEYQYRIDHNIPPYSTVEEYKSWQNRVIASVANAKAELARDPAMSSIEKAEYENVITLGLYRLENNIGLNLLDLENYDMESIGRSALWLALSQSVLLVSIIGIFMIVLTGSTVANEFSQGTIKSLLINPVKRWKILVAKYLTAMLIGYFMILLCYAVNVLLSILLFGTADLGATYITASNGEIISTPGLVYLLQKYAVSSVNVVVMATLAFAISSLLRSSAVATGVSVFAVFGGNMIVTLLYELNIDWARYLIFANTDLHSIARGSSDMGVVFENQTVGFAVGVIIVHMIVFWLTAWDGFTRREV